MEELKSLLLGQINSMDNDLKNQFIPIIKKKTTEIERAKSKRKQDSLFRNLVSVYQEFGIRMKITD